MAELFRVERPAGINRIKEQAQESPQFWQDSLDLKFQHGITRKVDGYEEGLGAALVTPDIIVPLRDDSGDYYWWAYVGLNPDYVGEDPSLPASEKRFNFFRIQSTILHTDVTPDVFYEPSDGRTYQWSGDTINGVPYLTYGVPYRYDEITGKFKMFENIPREDPNDITSPPRVRFNVIRTYRDFMIGMNFDTDSFAGYFDTIPSEPPIYWGPWEEDTHQNAVWWSHSVIGKDVDVRWEDANANLFSGWNFLGGSGGNVVDGRTLRDSFILYRELSVWQMSYIGGVQIFAFKEIFNDVGCLGLDCVVEIDGQHLVVGQSDVYMHNGVRKTSIADGIIRRELFRTIHPEYTKNVFIAVDYRAKEAWICIPEANQELRFIEEGLDPALYAGSCGIAYVYNWVENTWAKKKLPHITSSAYTILSIAAGDITWDAPSEGGPNDGNGNGTVVPGGTWATATDRWIDSYFKYNPSEWGLAATSKDGKIFTYLEDPLQNGMDFKGSVEKTFMDMGERLITKYVSRIYPLVRKGVVEVFTGFSMSIEEGIEWRSLGMFDPLIDEHISCRVTGRYIHVKFEIPETSRAEIRGYHVEFDFIGRR